MKKTETKNPTTGVTVVTSVILPGAAEQCAIREHGRECFNLMLFNGGAASLFALQMSEPSDPLTEALGRVLAEHSFLHSPPGPDLIRDIQERAEPVCEELAWADLAVGVCPPRASRKVACYPLVCEEAAALVLATDDPQMPMTQVVCTIPKPSRSLLIAIGRTVVGHHGFLLR